MLAENNSLNNLPQDKKNDENPKDKEKEEIKRKIIANKSVLEYKDAVSPFTFEKALEEGILELIKMGQTIPDEYISLISEETKRNIAQNQDLIKEAILKAIDIVPGIPTDYLTFVSKENLDDVLKAAIKKIILKSEFFLLGDAYESLSQKAILDLKEDQELQKRIQEIIKKAFINSYNFDKRLIYFTSPSTLKEISEDENFKDKESVKKIVKAYILKTRDIPSTFFAIIKPEIIEEVKQDKEIRDWVREEIEKAVSNFSDVLLGYLKIISREDLENIHSNSNMQEKIFIFVRNSILLKKGIFKEYISLASPQTLEKALKSAFSEFILQGESIPQEYSSFLTDKIKNDLKKDEGLMKKAINARIVKGRSIFDYYNSLPFEEKKRVLEKFKERKNLEELAKNSILNAFYDKALSQERKKEIMEIIEKEVLPFKSDEFLYRALFDKTFVPLGIKIHTKEEEGILDNYLEQGGGFVAHNYKQCYVIPPFPNIYSLELFFLTLENALRKHNNPLRKENAYIQVCFPERLPNELCGILTISFLYGVNKILKFTPDLLRHNQNRIGVTIYDAGKVDSRVHTVFDKEKNPHLLEVKGRTDVLFCRSLDDIRIAHTIYTLLFNAFYEKKNLFFKEEGEKFISEFKSLLEEYGKKDWLKAKFVDLEMNDLPQLSSILLEITKEKELLKKSLEEYYNVFAQYKIEDDIEKKNLLAKELQVRYAEIENNITTRVKRLLEKYYIHLITNSLLEIEDDADKY